MAEPGAAGQAAASQANVNTELAMRRTGMAFQRTRMAADRTLMAVIRTSLSLIGFGFTIYQFFNKLKDAGLLRGTAGGERNFGSTLVLLGIAMLVLGIVYHIRFMLETKDLGGKCADLNSLYVGLARSAGLPARDVYGIRVAKSQLGYKSLGASSEKVTKSQHCRAEVYLTQFGWVPVDPADVRKVVLEEPPGNRSFDDEMVASARKRLFGSWEMNWMAYNFAQDIELPGSGGTKINFLMYPQAQTAEGILDSLDPDNFKYEITVKEIA